MKKISEGALQCPYFHLNRRDYESESETLLSPYKSKKKPNRAKRKEELRKELKNY